MERRGGRAELNAACSGKESIDRIDTSRGDGLK